MEFPSFTVRQLTHGVFLPCQTINNASTDLTFREADTPAGLMRITLLSGIPSHLNLNQVKTSRKSSGSSLNLKTIAKNLFNLHSTHPCRADHQLWE